MALIGTAFAGLMAADGGRRDRNRPEGALRALSAYLIGFSAIRTGANAYVHLSTLGRLLQRDDSYALAILSTIAACVPLTAGILLSSGRIDAERRFAMLPIPGRTRLAIAALGPVIAALPVLALASALPMLAALPIASYSVPDYLKVAFWYPLACATVSLGLKSFFGAARRTIGPRMKKGGQERRVALAVMLMAAAIANPRPAIVGGKGILALFGSTSIAAEAGTRLSFPLARPAMAILVLGIFIALAAAAAVLEDIASREPRARLTSHTDGPGRRKRPVPIMVLVVDAERRIAPGLAVSLPLAMITVFQGAAPWIPLAFAAVAMSVRTGAALLFLATDGETARRFALIPAGPGTVDRAFLAAAVAASSLAAAPLVAAGLGLAIWS